MNEMKKLSLLIVSLMILATATGCWKDRLELFLNADGSGRLVQTITFSERFVVAIREFEDKDSPQPTHAPPITEDKFREEVGDALEITKLDLKELDDGRLRVHLEGTFDDAEQFFGSSYARDNCSLSLNRPNEDEIAIVGHYEIESEGNLQLGDDMNLNVMYGLIKGHRQERIIHLPAEPVRTRGDVSPEGDKTVRWLVDLTDREGLKNAREFVEGPTKGRGMAVLPASAFSLEIPKEAVTTGEPDEDEEKAIPHKKAEEAKARGIEIKPGGLEWKRGRELLEEVFVGHDYCRVHLLITWPKGDAPVAWYDPYVESCEDNLGNDLVDPEEHHHRHTARDDDTSEKIAATLKAPPREATELVGLEGYVRVVTEQETAGGTFDRVRKLAGKDSTGNASLDAVDFKILEVEEDRIELSVRGGRGAIKEHKLIGPDGQEIDPNPSLSWSGNEVTLYFDQDIPDDATLKVTIVTDERIVKVPFSADRLKLP